MEYLVPVVIAILVVCALVGVVVWRATRTNDDTHTPPTAGGAPHPDATGARSEASRTDSERLSDRSV